MYWRCIRSRWRDAYEVCIGDAYMGGVYEVGLLEIVYEVGVLQMYKR